MHTLGWAVEVLIVLGTLAIGTRPEATQLPTPERSARCYELAKEIAAQKPAADDPRTREAIADAFERVPLSNPIEPASRLMAL